MKRYFIRNKRNIIFLTIVFSFQLLIPNVDLIPENLERTDILVELAISLLSIYCLVDIQKGYIKLEKESEKFQSFKKAGYMVKKESNLQFCFWFSIFASLLYIASFICLPNLLAITFYVLAARTMYFSSASFMLAVFDSFFSSVK